MKVLILILIVGLVGFGAAGFLLHKAREAADKERKAQTLADEQEERIRRTFGALEGYVGYYEIDDSFLVFVDAMRVTESDSPIDDVYAALEDVGAEALVPPLRRMVEIHLEEYERTKHLNSFRDEDEINRISAEYSEQFAAAEKEIKATGLKVYDILNDYWDEHSDVLGERQK